MGMRLGNPMMTSKGQDPVESGVGQLEFPIGAREDGTPVRRRHQDASITRVTLKEHRHGGWRHGKALGGPLA